MWVCGLKRLLRELHSSQNLVAPYVGVWIETELVEVERIPDGSRTLCGCVD